MKEDRRMKLQKKKFNSNHLLAIFIVVCGLLAGISVFAGGVLTPVKNHLAGDDQVVAGGDLFSHQCNAGENGTFCLLPRHSRLMGKVAGAGGDLSGNYAVAVQFLRHADVHGKNICPADTGQGVD